MNTSLITPRTENGTLALPGVEFHKNQLEIKGDLNSDQITRLLTFLVAFHDCSLFWFGDALVWIKENKSESAAMEAAKQSDNSDKLLEAMTVCSNLKSRKKVSYAHHREAYCETNRDTQEALKWLAKAESYQWSVAEMRRQIRMDGSAKARSESSKGSATLTTIISQLKSRIANMDRSIDDWTIDEVVAMSDEFKPVEEFGRKLRDRFNQFNPRLMDV